MRCHTRGRTCGRQNVLFGHAGCGSVPFSLFRSRLMALSDRSPFCSDIQDAGMLPVSALSSCAWQARSVKPCPGQGACPQQHMQWWASAGECVLAPGSVAPSSGMSGWESCCWRPKRQAGTHSAGSSPATALTGWSSAPRRAVGSCSRHDLVFSYRSHARLLPTPVHAGWRCSKGLGAHPVSSLYAR